MGAGRGRASLGVVDAWLLCRVFRYAGLAACLGLPVIVTQGAATQAASPKVEEAIHAELMRFTSEAIDLDAVQLDLLTFYQRNAYSLVWTDDRGRPNPDAAEMLPLVRAVADEGLDPFDYQSVELDERAQEQDGSSAWRAAFDVQLSVNALRYLRQLHVGRMDPRAIGFQIVAPVEQHDFPEMLRSALSGHRVAAAVADLTPRLVQYRELLAMLKTYRSLAANAELQSIVLSTATTTPGEPRDDLGALCRWLVALGDLPAPTPPPESIYDGALIDGVKHFQARHGLAPDGIIGNDTLRALHVPLAWRVRQIELALERLRWLPDLDDTRFLAVNIPMFHLWGWDSVRPDGIPAFDTGVIVGRAVNHKTPVFVADIRSIIFRPYWNVPTSIVRAEILPALARDPDYLQREEMEIVPREGESGGGLELTEDNLRQLREGKLLLRQRPGPGNALGLIKFVFPNENDVYMHATPARALFSRARRDFSHGCVRVEDPIALAEWVLEEQPEWTRERIVAAMQGSETQQVDLARPIPVILFYVTAAFLPQDETIHFAEDIYRHDAMLDLALRRHTETAK